MISFKSFVNAIHEAIINASDTLMAKNEGFFDRYFIETKTESSAEKDSITTLTPRTVTLEYPFLSTPPERTPPLKLGSTQPLYGGLNTGDTGEPNPPTNEPNVETEYLKIQVPLITLVSLSMPQIEKAVLTADFEIQIVDGELQLNFPSSSTTGSSQGIFKKSKTTKGKLEITISPQAPSEGLKKIIQSYEDVLKRQIP